MDIHARAPQRRFRKHYSRPDAQIPEPLSDCLLESVVDESRLLEVCPVLGVPLNPLNYGEAFRICLQLEEFDHCYIRNVPLQIVKRPRRPDPFGKDNVTEHGYCSVDLRRSSKQYLIQPLDPVDLRSEKGTARGAVVQVKGFHVTIGVTSNMETIRKHEHELYNVKIHSSRVASTFDPMRNAVHAAPFRLNSVLFPLRVEKTRTSQLPVGSALPGNDGMDPTLDTAGVATNSHGQFLVFNEKLNQEQRQAVEQAVLGEARPLPYLISGPPGTGKTITLVEIIIQLALQIPRCRILVCAPSLSAIVQLFSLLISSKQRDSVWSQTGWLLFAKDAEQVRAVPIALREHCQVVHPDLHEQLVFCTCETVGLIAQICRRRFDWFTHVIIDEAHALIEPECLVPLNFCHACADMQIVLSGDAFQMLPRVTSYLAQQFGLENSLFFRLLDRPPYQKDGPLYDKRCATHLKKNYRSVLDVLSIVSRIFYEGQLISGIQETSSSKTDYVRQNPLVFMPTGGKEQIREFSSFNKVEAKGIVSYLQSLYRKGVKRREVIVLTGSRYQAKLVKKNMKRQKVRAPKVGLVEDFVGQESSIVIISTVQTTFRFTSLEGQEGLLGVPDRSIAALTRARHHVCIIGCEDLLVQDLLWKEVVSSARKIDWKEFGEI